MNRNKAIEMLTQISAASEELIAGLRDMDVSSTLAQQELGMAASALLVPMAQVLGELSTRGITDDSDSEDTQP